MTPKCSPAYTFTVEFPAPLDIPASLEIFRRTGDDGLDRWDGRVLVRTTRVDDAVVPFIGAVIGTVDAPALEVTVAHATHAAAVERTVQTMFVTAPAPLAALIAIDPIIARLERRFPGLRDQPDAEVIACLTACRGLGRWTAEWFLARALGRPRVVAGDLGVRKAIGAAYCNGNLPSETDVRELTGHWGAAAGVAQQLLLHGLSQGFA